MTHNTREVEEAAKDWLFAGDEPKPGDEVVYKEFVDFLADFLHHQLQKAREKDKQLLFDCTKRLQKVSELQDTIEILKQVGRKTIKVKDLEHYLEIHLAELDQDKR